MRLRSFLSDNTASVHPAVLAAIARVNEGHSSAAYGDDAYSQQVAARVAALCGGGEAFFVFNGTGANVLSLSAMMRPHEAVLCAEGAHVAVDECGAAERYVGCKVVELPTPDGKLTPALVERALARVGDQHAVQPRVVTITQATETGLVYSPAEVRALADAAHARGLRLHMDGARAANAAAHLGASLSSFSRDADAVAPLTGRDSPASLASFTGDADAVAPLTGRDSPASLASFTGDAGVDALCLGGTKDGALAAEAVVLFDPLLARDFKFVRKQGMQLASKMRYVAAQFDALLEDDLWLANARHANAMARLLAREAANVPGVCVPRDVQANAVFATMPRAAIAPLQAEWPFYVWDATRDLVRWVASWDTTEDDVRAFVEALRRRAEAPA